MSQPQTVKQEAQSLRINGVWLDVGFPENRSEIIQDGASFRFNRLGYLTEGSIFESSGSGSLDGHMISMSYVSRYANGGVSRGQCSGSLSTSGKQMNLNCTDDQFGSNSLSAIKQ